MIVLFGTMISSLPPCGFFDQPRLLYTQADLGRAGREHDGAVEGRNAILRLPSRHHLHVTPDGVARISHREQSVP